jgi:type II secretory ATPase GspE/PulE/Tfp pilus assembly ATPase PilB-like protein
MLINVHLLVNELCEYQNARCNDKNSTYPIPLKTSTDISMKATEKCHGVTSKGRMEIRSCAKLSTGTKTPCD